MVLKLGRMSLSPPLSTLFPYTTLFRSPWVPPPAMRASSPTARAKRKTRPSPTSPSAPARGRSRPRSEEHTSELQSQSNLVCRLLLEKKKSDRVHVRDDLRVEALVVEDE